MINHYWRHNPTGAVYAVQRDRDEIRAVCGPLPASDITLANLHVFRFSIPADPGLAAEVASARDTYTCLEPGMLHYEGQEGRAE